MMKKKHLLIILLSISLLTLTGCQSVENWFKNAKEEWIALEMTVRTYDENSQLIDQMSGKKKVILIRSQNGTPLAAYAGDRVSLDKSDAPKTSELLIDGKRLVIYRCDYTIYDRELLE